MSMDDLKDRVRLREPASSVESAEPALLVDDVPVRYGRFPTARPSSTRTPTSGPTTCWPSAGS
jgi:hypothetical protein